MFCTTIWGGYIIFKLIHSFWNENFCLCHIVIYHIRNDNFKFSMLIYSQNRIHLSFIRYCGFMRRSWWAETRHLFISSVSWNDTWNEILYSFWWDLNVWRLHASWHWMSNVRVRFGVFMPVQPVIRDNLWNSLLWNVNEVSTFRNSDG